MKHRVNTATLEKQSELKMKHTDCNVHHDFIKVTAKHWPQCAPRDCVRVRGESLHYMFLAQWKFSLPGLEPRRPSPTTKRAAKRALLRAVYRDRLPPFLAIHIYKLCKFHPFFRFGSTLKVKIFTHFLINTPSMCCLFSLRTFYFIFRALFGIRSHHQQADFIVKSKKTVWRFGHFWHLGHGNYVDCKS
jgi:hypothetical protein